MFLFSNKILVETSLSNDLKRTKQKSKKTPKHYNTSYFTTNLSNEDALKTPKFHAYIDFNPAYICVGSGECHSDLNLKHSVGAAEFVSCFLAFLHKGMSFTFWSSKI